MNRTFTSQTWAHLDELVRRFETSYADSRSKEKRELQAAVRSLGFSALELGVTKITRPGLDELLEEAACESECRFSIHIGVPILGTRIQL